MKTIGFVGLGNIGTPMSQNLLQAGFDVIGFDLVQNPAFVKAGGRFAETVQDVGRQAEVIIQSLPGVEALESTIAGLLEVAHGGQVVIDISGYPLPAKQQAADSLARHGVVMWHNYAITSLRFDPADQRIVSGAGHSARVWRVANNQPLTPLIPIEV